MPQESFAFQTLVNLLVKQALRESDLTQIGKKTHFFKESAGIEIDGIKCIPGY